MKSNIIRRSHRPAAPRQPAPIVARGAVFNIQRGNDSTSRQVQYTDDWSILQGSPGSRLLAPPFSPHRLFEILEMSNIAPQCIEAYVINTVGTGWEVEPVVRGTVMNGTEEVELKTHIEHANSEQSLMTVMKAVISHREAVGYGFMEVIRNRFGDPSLWRHASSLFTRLTEKDEQEVLVEYTIQRGRRLVDVREYRRFRRFVQVVGSQTTWFKEFGDPRPMNRVTGLYSHEPGYRAGMEATEIFHFKIGEGIYGTPRWINQIPSILGSREAEEVNLNYFKDNTIPPVLLTVSGGRLTRQSYAEIQKMVQQSSARDVQNRVTLLEAVGIAETMDENATPVQMKVEKLTDSRQSDGLWQKYDEANQNKVRSCWRLPPIVLGLSAEQNFANAQVSTFVAESQVFGPDRDAIDEQLNCHLVNGPNGLGFRSVRLKGRVPSINSPETVIKTLTALNVMGAVTPRSAQMVANQVLQTELPAYPAKGEDGYEPWMDLPIAMSVRKPNEGTGEKTHSEQALKTDEQKALEEDGFPGFKQPEKGTEGRVLP